MEQLGDCDATLEFEGDVRMGQDHLGWVGVITGPKLFEEVSHERTEPSLLLLAQRVATDNHRTPVGVSLAVDVGAVHCKSFRSRPSRFRIFCLRSSIV